MRKITHATWYTDSKGTMGIVITVSEPMDDHRAYIGIVEGQNKIDDLKYIATKGAKFPLGAALLIMNNQGEKLPEPIELNQ